MRAEHAGSGWLLGYAAVAVANLVAAALDLDLVGIATLVAAMPLLFAWFLAHRPPRDHTFWLLAGALAFSWIGDGLGVFSLLVKLAAFLCGHVCYIAVFWPNRSRSVLRRPVILLGYVVVIGALLAWIAPHSGALAPLGVAYGILLGLMAVLATGLNRLAAVGGVLFVISDLTIAVTLWALRVGSPVTEVLIMSTYLAAQLLLVAGVVRDRYAMVDLPAPAG